MFHYALFAAIVLAVLCYMDWQVRRVFSFYGVGRKKWYVTCLRAVFFSGFALLIALWPPGIVIILHFFRRLYRDEFNGSDNKANWQAQTG